MVVGLFTDIPTAVNSYSIQPSALCLWPNHIHGVIREQPHSHQCNIQKNSQLLILRIKSGLYSPCPKPLIP